MTSTGLASLLAWVSPTHTHIFRPLRSTPDLILVPSTLAYVFPFVLAFAPGVIEVRTLINGKLVQMLEIPGIKFLTSKKEVYIASSTSDRKDTDILRIAFGE